jgi:hypothetical protein
MFYFCDAQPGNVALSLCIFWRKYTLIVRLPRAFSQRKKRFSGIDGMHRALLVE